MTTDNAAAHAPRDTYSHGHSASVLASHGRRTAANSAGYLLGWLRPTDRLLDVGVGPGTITTDFAERLPEGWVTGVDNAEAAIAAARAWATGKGTQRLTLTTGDVYALDYPDGAFDVVHAHQVLQHLSDPVAALVEMRRVCAPDGLVAVRETDYAAMTWYPAHPSLDRWRRLYEQVARGNRGEPNAGRRLRSWAQRAGLTEVRCGASTWCFSTADELDWWTRTWAGRLTDSDLARQAVDRGLTTVAELAELARDFVAWGQAEDAWFALLHGEVLAGGRLR